jgi:hypothetical protein
MASFAYTAVMLAGALALTQAGVAILAVRALRRKGLMPMPPSQMSEESVLRSMLSRFFTPILFGILSLTFAGSMTASPLGRALCLGMSMHFALVSWSYLRSPEMRAAGPYIGTYVAVGASILYLLAVLA